MILQMKDREKMGKVGGRIPTEVTSTEEDRPDTGLKTRGTLRKIEDSRKVSVFARAGRKPDLRGHKNIMSLGTEREWRQKWRSGDT